MSPTLISPDSPAIPPEVGSGGHGSTDEKSFWSGAWWLWGFCVPDSNRHPGVEAQLLHSVIVGRFLEILEFVCWPRPISALGNCKSGSQRCWPHCTDETLHKLNWGGSSTARTMPCRWLLCLVCISNNQLSQDNKVRLNKGLSVFLLQLFSWWSDHLHQVPADHGGLRMNITRKMFDELRLLTAICIRRRAWHVQTQMKMSAHTWHAPLHTLFIFIHHLFQLFDCLLWEGASDMIHSEVSQLQAWCDCCFLHAAALPFPGRTPTPQSFSACWNCTVPHVPHVPRSLLRFCSALRVSEVRKDGPVASLHRSHLGTQSSTLPRALGTSLHRVWNPNHIGSSAFDASNASNIFQSVGSSDGHRYSLDIVIKCTDGALSLFSFFLYAVPEKNRLLDYWFWVLAMISDPLVNNPAKAGAFQANPLQQCCRCQSRALIKAVAPLVLESWDHWISRISAGRKREASLNYNLHLKIWYNVMG